MCSKPTITGHTISTEIKNKCKSQEWKGMNVIKFANPFVPFTHNYKF